MRSWKKAVRFDLRFGVLRLWWAFLPALLWGIFAVLRADAAYAAGVTMGECAASARFTLADVCLYVFGGMSRFIPAAGQPFEIPVEWMVWHVYLALLVSQYAYRNLCGIGQQMLIRFQKRRVWWVGKCVWSLVTVAIAYAVLFGAMAAGTAVCGALSPNLSVWFGNVVKFPLTPGQCALGWSRIAVLVLLSFAVSAALCLWQTALSLLIRPLGGFLVSLVFLASSAYVPSPALFGNYAMWERSLWLGADTFAPISGFLICLSVWMAAVALGGLLFAKKDILHIQE